MMPYIGPYENTAMTTTAGSTIRYNGQCLAISRRSRCQKVSCEVLSRESFEDLMEIILSVVHIPGNVPPDAHIINADMPICKCSKYAFSLKNRLVCYVKYTFSKTELLKIHSNIEYPARIDNRFLLCYN